MWFIGVKVEQETSAPPPKKNPGSAPDMYTQLMEKQGAKLTNAAYELTEEQSRLLYEDMFKPLDVFALI